jgi:hypothetical protein
MKRVLAGLCAGVLALALLGCGEEAPKKPTTPEKPKTEGTEKPAPATPPAEAPKEEKKS